jgi:hypothetical protein
MSVSRTAFLPSILFSTSASAGPHAGDTLSIVPFLSLAREMAALLVPLEPRAEFRAELERTLVAEARQQAVQGRLMPTPLDYREPPERRWMVGAAAAAAVGSAVSIASIMVYVWRRRERAA